MELEKKFELTTPIMFGDEEITSLKLRKPTVKEIREIGFPFLISLDEDLSINAKICAKHLSRMSALPMSVIDKMSAEDFKEVCWEILSFFGEESREKKVS